MTTVLHATNIVSAKLMAGEEAEAIVAAVLAHNPQASFEDHGSYLSVSSPKILVFDIEQISEELGRPYNVPTLLVVLSSYTGQVDVQDNRLTIKEAAAD
jgi:MmoB/DmpM family